ncbi:MAG TPA: metalloregulator ArsR/SmtB family transcription factor [Blastocatellia bacterium]|nr:metalloregulator ArsR/SmtB family transcription factor [Blastocatellia bacterium]
MTQGKAPARRKSPAGLKWLPQLAALFKACADETRLRLLNLLAAEGEVCVCHLVDVLGTNQPKVSRHLAYLKRAGLVSDRKDGLWVYYRLAAPLAEHAGRLIECLNSCLLESPEMQRDVAKLREMQDGQTLVGPARRSRLVLGKPEVTASVDTPLSLSQPAPEPFRPEPDLRVELL